MESLAAKDGVEVFETNFKKIMMNDGIAFPKYVAQTYARPAPVYIDKYAVSKFCEDSKALMSKNVILASQLDKAYLVLEHSSQNHKGVNQESVQLFVVLHGKAQIIDKLQWEIKNAKGIMDFVKNNVDWNNKAY